MSEISDLESRITSAMDRIGRGLENLQAGGQDDSADELAQLRAALEEEKTVSAQLEERIRGLREKQDAELAAVQQSGVAQRQATKELDDRLQRVTRTNQQLRENNRALREANQQAVGEPHLINKSMLAELEALRASREVDQAEIGAMIATLRPLVAAPDEAGSDAGTDEAKSAEISMGDA
jgi:DNA repair exonuclease SbcCD ATPase subunit